MASAFGESGSFSFGKSSSIFFANSLVFFLISSVIAFSVFISSKICSSQDLLSVSGAVFFSEAVSSDDSPSNCCNKESINS